MESRTLYLYDKPSDSVLPQHTDLNNFYLSPFQQEGLSYLTVEHFYQAHKYPKGSADFETVRVAPTPNQAKHLTRTQPYDKDWWEGAKDEVMAQALTLKYDQNPKLLERLLWTWDCRLVEDSWQDPYWGGRLPGAKNRLGQMLMEERERRRKGLERVPVPSLAWLTRPVHSLYPPPVPSRVQALETVLTTLPATDSLEMALSQHPIFAHLTADSVQELVTSEASYLTIPPGRQQDSIFPLIYVLAGSGEMETHSRFPISAGMWISRSSPGVYFASESELKVAEVKVEKALACLVKDTNQEYLSSQVICSTMGHFQAFRTQVAALAAGQPCSPVDLTASLSQSWPQFLTPETALESLLYLPITAAAVQTYILKLSPITDSPHFYQLPNQTMEVTLSPSQLEQFCFHLTVFLDLRKRLHTEAVPSRIVEALQQQAAEPLEQLIQTEGSEIQLRVERLDWTWKQVFSDYDINKVDIWLGDLENMKSVFSPYLQLISSTAEAFTALCHPTGPAKSLFSALRFYLLVNPEQVHRAQAFDSQLGCFSLPNALILTPEVLRLLGLQRSTHLVCLNLSGGLETAKLMEEIGTKVQSVRVVEKWQCRAAGREVGRYWSEAGSIQCGEEGLLAYVPREIGYLTDPLTAKCMEIAPKDAFISRLSGDIFEILCRIAQNKRIEVKGVVPHSEQEEWALLEGWKSCPIAEKVVFVLFGPISEQLSGLYEGAFSHVSSSQPICELLTAESAFSYAIPTSDLVQAVKDAQTHSRRRSDRRLALWSLSHLQFLLQTLPLASKVFLFSAVPVPIAIYAHCQAAVSHYTTEDNADYDVATAFRYTAGQWQSLDSTSSLTSALDRSLS